ncbi:MAG: hypothetical protein HY360_03585 [Verrucomicrobia bacterium]|nr:hypothetical protein [Verrucomicrobiota bacterium]
MNLKLTTAWVFLFSGLALPSHGGESRVYRADSSGLPKIDYTKTFEWKSSSRFEREFATRSFQTPHVDLPDYMGNLKPLSLAEWRSGKSEFSSQTVPLRDFETGAASGKWSQPLSLGEWDRTLPQMMLDLEQSEARGVSSIVNAGNSVELQILEGEIVKQIINHGRVGSLEPGRVRVGSGFGARPVEEKVREKPETSPPPKSEPGR